MSKMQIWLNFREVFVINPHAKLASSIWQVEKEKRKSKYFRN